MTNWMIFAIRQSTKDHVEDFLALLAIIAVVATVALVIAGYAYGRSLTRQLRRFFDTDPTKLPVVNRSFYTLDLPNLQLAIARYAEGHSTKDRIMGFDGSIGERASFFTRPKPIRYQDVDVDVDRQMQCMLNAVHLLDSPRGKIAVQIHSWGEQSLMLRVLALTKEQASQFIEDIRKLVSQCSVYRGKVISLEHNPDAHGAKGFANVRFHRLQSVRRDDIVLPNPTMLAIERNSIRFFSHAEALRHSGQAVKRGLLFYGEPGTGKTYTAKWLAQSLKGLTVILLAGEQLSLIKECCEIARMLAPSLVIMEDIDLVATTRDQLLHNTVLHQLLNEMDGLEPDAEVVFLLTTNRPQVIEPALAERPGRIDQAIEFPLPDHDCRRRLITLYTRGLTLDLEDPERPIAKTEGASPAFIRELVRKAALFAAEDNSLRDGTLRVTDQHFELALRELEMSSLTHRLFGFRAEAEGH